MIIQFSKDVGTLYPSIYDHIEAKGIWYPVYYIIDSKLRQAHDLQKWLAEQLATPPKDIVDLAKDLKGPNHDYTVTNVLRWVEENITYTPDLTVWKMDEYWQTAEETFNKKTGDCEDGAILSYVLNTLAGVPSNRMLIFAGTVKGGGHCWLGYKSLEYPLNWCFLDWCYWFNRVIPNERTKYYIKDTTIYDDPTLNYVNIWFAFNHVNSYKGILNSK